MNSSQTIQPRRLKHTIPLGCLAYIILGLYVGCIDSQALVLYLTVLPLQFLFLVYGYKSKNLMLFMFLLFMFLTQGINPIFFYMGRDGYSATGFSAIGDFDFTLNRYFTAYSYILVFCLSLVIMDYLMQNGKKRQDYVMVYIKGLANKFVQQKAASQSRALWLMLLFTILMCMLSMWMYENRIGMIGLTSKKLPYHLSGILFYFRRLVASCILIYLYTRCSQKRAAFILAVVYALIIGVTATSRSVAALVLLSIAAYSFVINEKWKGLTAILVFGIVYIMISVGREFVFAQDTIIYSPLEVFHLIFTNLFSGEENMLLEFLSGFTGRLYGSQVLVLIDQQYVASIGDLFNWYLTGRNNFDILGMHGVTFNEDSDFAFGIGVGFIGYMILLSCHHLFLAALQGLIIAVLLKVSNHNIQAVISSRAGFLYKTGALGILAYSFMALWGGGMVSFYICMVMVYAVRKLTSKHNTLQ